jgi:membrane associated rhomboid family serine protease
MTVGAGGRAEEASVFPYRDDNPTVLTPVITLAIIGLNVLVWVFVQGLGTGDAMVASICRLGLTPGELLGTVEPGASIELAPGRFCPIDAGPAWHTVVTSMFLHGGWLHLIGNMVFLWVFGNNIEDSMGHVRFVIFYLLCGIAAAGAQVVVSPSSVVPMVGASGAISGVMGGYLLLYPRARVHTIVFFGFITTVDLPAYVLLGYWILLQILGGLPALVEVGTGGGVAFWAHVGGFAGGMLLIRLFESSEHAARRPAPVSARRRQTWY